MEGERFFAYNFATFSKDAGVWSYRDIQKLCVSLGINAKGKRGRLVRKLAEWHRSRYEDDSCLVPLVDPNSEENIPMNVLGNNFGLLPVNVTTEKPPTKTSRSSSKKRKSLVSSEDEPAIVSPNILRPLEKRETCGSPRSILKRSKRDSPTIDSEKKSVAPTSTSTHADAQKLEHITFSPYNAVQIIAHRTDNHDNPEGWHYVDPMDNNQDVYEDYDDEEAEDGGNECIGDYNELEDVEEDEEDNDEYY